MIEKLDEFFTKSIEVLSKNKIKNKHIYQVVINSDFFKDDFLPNFKGLDKSTYLSEQLMMLENVKGPVLYWFEFDKAVDKNNLLREKYFNYKNMILKSNDPLKYRNTSSYKKQFCEDSDVLYVGKVEKDFYQRIKTHLGFATSPKTAGMQLHHWYAQNITEFGDLRLNYIVFTPDMIYLISTLEKIIAQKLKPLIGRY